MSRKCYRAEWSSVCSRGLTWSPAWLQSSPRSACLRIPSRRSNRRSRSSRLSMGPMGQVEEAIWSKDGTGMRAPPHPSPICIPLQVCPARVQFPLKPQVCFHPQICAEGLTQRCPGEKSQFLQKVLNSPGQVAQLVGTSFRTPERLRVQSLVRAHTGSDRPMFLFHIVVPLSLFPSPGLLL